MQLQSIVAILICCCCFINSSLASGFIQTIRDEFNTTESILYHSTNNDNLNNNNILIANKQKNHFERLLKKTLMRFELDNCCPSWTNLSRAISKQLLEIEQSTSAPKPTTSGASSFYGLGRSSSSSLSSSSTLQQQRHSNSNKSELGQDKNNDTLKLDDLFGVLSKAFYNISQLSIDGQVGQNEAEKYYKFYDNVQYYLRLLKVSQNYLDNDESKQTMNRQSDGTLNSTLNPDEGEFFELLDQRLAFRRQLEGIKFKLSNDPIITSFIEELNKSTTRPEINGTESNNKSKQLHNNNYNNNFELYESFLKNTIFGQHYARNISMVRDSVRVFDQICMHLARLTFPSNFTKPSKQYGMIHKMSQRLFQIKHDLKHQINPRILSNRHDTRMLFRHLDELIENRPEIRMLGDEFSTGGSGGDGETEQEILYSRNVKRLTNALDRYTTNNMTQLSFYNELAELPEEFILFGSLIAREYEQRELSQYNKFDFKHFGSNGLIMGDSFMFDTHDHHHRPIKNNNDINATSTAGSDGAAANDAADAVRRQSTGSFLLNTLIG